MKLIENWRQAWRWWSVRVAATGVVTTAVLLAAPELLLQFWRSLPETVVAWVPDTIRTWTELALFAATIGARILQQREGSDDDA